MIETYLLEALAAVQQCGTLSAAAEELHLTQPTLSRSIKKLESEIGVPLFRHEKNKLTLNENGILAAKLAEEILAKNRELAETVRENDRRSKTILISSCAPGPVFHLTGLLNDAFPDKIVRSEILKEEEILEKLKKGDTDLAVIDHLFQDDPLLYTRDLCDEELYLSLPKKDRRAKRKSISFAEMNGETFLMTSQIGTWMDVKKEFMPDSKYLLQKDLEELNQLIKASTLPAFATNLSIDRHKETDRIYIPFKDEAAVKHFFLVMRKKDRRKYAELFSD